MGADDVAAVAAVRKPKKEKFIYPDGDCAVCIFNVNHTFTHAKLDSYMRRRFGMTLRCTVSNGKTSPYPGIGMVVFQTPGDAARCVEALDGEYLREVTQEGQKLIAAAGPTLPQANTNVNVRHHMQMMLATGVSVNVDVRAVVEFVYLIGFCESVKIESVNE
jgi:hypothetical protein